MAQGSRRARDAKTGEDVYGLLAPAYELLASPGRIRAEIEAILPALTEIDARRVLDAGCAVGIHSRELARLGFDVVGLDASDAMIREARRRSAGSDLTVRFVRREIADAGGLGGKPFDAVLCLGNTMAYAGTKRERHAALRAFRRAMRPDGLLILQLRDLHSVRETGHVFPVRALRQGDEEWILLRRQTPEGRRMRFLSILLHRSETGGEWVMRTSENVQSISAPVDWRGSLARAGFVRVRLAGDLHGRPRPRRGGPDLVVFAHGGSVR